MGENRRDFRRNHLKDRRRRPEGGECEPIKISQWNLAYITKSTRRTSLLTPSRPHNYQEAIALGTGLETIVKTRIDANKNTCETDNKNRTKTQFMSSQAFLRTPCRRELENAVKDQFVLGTLESFEPTTQDQYRTCSCNNSRQEPHKHVLARASRVNKKNHRARKGTRVKTGAQI
jgi:hypothetical protein